jgi:hypothetical protein
MYDTLLPGNRRVAPRVRLQSALNQYVCDDPFPALAVDVSENGLALNMSAAPARYPHVVGLELLLPGTGEIIWASAEPRFHTTGNGIHQSGLQFVAMARKHERLIRDYVRERRERLARLFSPRRLYVSRFGCVFS